MSSAFTTSISGLARPSGTRSDRSCGSEWDARIGSSIPPEEEQFCVEHPTATYNAVERGSSLPTFGGYSNNYVVDQRFALQVSPKRSFWKNTPTG